MVTLARRAHIAQMTRSASHRKDAVDPSKTAGPSTTLRSGRDDNSAAPGKEATGQLLTCNRIVIPTGAKRSGGTCCFLSVSHRLEGRGTKLILLMKQGIIDIRPDFLKGENTAINRKIRNPALISLRKCAFLTRIIKISNP